MSFQLSRETNLGFNLAISHATLAESGSRSQGLPTLSEQGLTPDEIHARLAYWFGQILVGDPVEALAVLGYQALACAGGLMAADERSPFTGDEVGVLRQASA